MGMYRKLILFLVGTMAVLQVPAQALNVEAESYRLYRSGAWKRMLAFHDSLHEAGTDYYYLRVRSAWAWYNLGKPIPALKQLEAASRYWQNPEDQDFHLRLVDLCGEGLAAERIQYRSASQTAMRRLFPEPFLRSIQLEAGGLVTNDPLASTAPPLLNTPGSILGTQDVLHSLPTGNIALRHSLLPGFSLYHQITWMQLNRTVETGWRNGYRAYPYTGNQLQYYLSADYETARRWKISPAVHLIRYRQIREWTESALPPGTVQQGLDTIALRDYILSAEVSRRFGRVRPAISVSTGQMNNQNPTQACANLTWYPTGRADAYLSGMLTGLFVSGNPFWIPGISGGATIAGPWYAEGGFTLGNFINYSEYNGRLLFNIADPIRWKSFFTLMYRNPTWNARLTVPVQMRERYLTWEVVEPAGNFYVRRDNRSYLAYGLLLQFQYIFKTIKP